MLTVRLVLMGMILCVSCLLDVQAKVFSRDVIKQVEILMEKDSLTMCAGCKLYTPNLGDYKRSKSSSWSGKSVPNPHWRGASSFLRQNSPPRQSLNHVSVSSTRRKTPKTSSHS
uniref:interleukin 15, like isoform X3 n=1 Tax=Doryrhamphus excisus TaxID=161450 RepID=UPI0025AE5C34|nr:interleukin 15, like isoform X3 [Doryrhamphus excisus]